MSTHTQLICDNCGKTVEARYNTGFFTIDRAMDAIDISTHGDVQLPVDCCSIQCAISLLQQIHYIAEWSDTSRKSVKDS